jgi:hypothetical protein
MDKFSVQSDVSSEVAVVTASGRIDSETAPNLDAELSRVVMVKRTGLFSI